MIESLSLAFFDGSITQGSHATRLTIRNSGRKAGASSIYSP